MKERTARCARDNRTMDVDDYNLPIGILGLHPEDFYGSVGRIVCVCAVLEQQLTAMRHALAHVEQGKYTHEPVSEQIKAARALSLVLPHPAGQHIRDFLSRVVEAFDRRNEVVHSAFPAQPDGRIWGHRPVRDKTVLDGRASFVETNLADLKAYIADLSKLVQDFNQVFAYCAYRANTP
jgi:hypothetical protein